MEDKTQIGIHFGALAPKLKEQLKSFQLDDMKLQHIQLDADAITRLLIRGLIPDSVAHKTRQKLIKNITKSIHK